MVINDRDTKIEISITNSSSNIGLGEDNNWCLVEYSITNHEVNFTGSKELISKKELLFIKDKLEQLVNGEVKKKENIKFIKNFFRLNLYKNSLEVIIINIDNKNTNYKLLLEKEEVNDLLLILNNY